MWNCPEDHGGSCYARVPWPAWEEALKNADHAYQDVKAGTKAAEGADDAAKAGGTAAKGGSTAAKADQEAAARKLAQ